MTAELQPETPIQPETPLELQIADAQERLRAANRSWGEQIGATEEEIHDLGAPRTRLAVEMAESAGQQLRQLLDKRPRLEDTVPVQGLFRVFGKEYKTLAKILYKLR